MNIPFINSSHVAAVRVAHEESMDVCAGVAPFCIFVALVVCSRSNAVNLTDGLDGLAIGLMVIAAGALTALTYAGGHAQLAEYLQLARNPPHVGTDGLLRVDDRASVASCGITRIGGYFMGDVGALGLGGAMAVGGGAHQAGSAAGVHRRRLRGGGAFGHPAGGQLQACAASGSSRWRRCTIISRRWGGRNRRSSRASGSRAGDGAVALSTLKLR